MGVARVAIVPLLAGMWPATFDLIMRIPTPRRAVAVLLMLLAWVLPAQAQLDPASRKLQLGCGWMLAFDPNVPGLGNTALPETNARYWVAVVSDSVPAGSRLRIEGRYPEARYSGLHVHDGNLFIHDALSDNELLPDPGSVNRNRDRTVRDVAHPVGGHYTAYVRINQALPAVREKNTLYRKPPALLDAPVKRRTALAYRTYLPVGDNTGGVGLPRLVLETPQGERSLPNDADGATCAAIQRQFQDPRPGLVSLTPPLVPEGQPVFRKFDGATLNALGLGVGFNPHNGFMSIKTERAYADVLLIRGQLPTYTTQIQPQPVPQVRYWSLCQYGAASTRVVDCLADRQLRLDAQGRYNIAISAHDARPALLPTAYAWLPWGPEAQGAVMVRELLAHPDFSQSIEKATTRNTAADRSGFMPLATYCSLPVLDAALREGGAPDTVFARCASAFAANVPPALPLPGVPGLPPLLRPRAGF